MSNPYPIAVLFAALSIGAQAGTPTVYSALIEQSGAVGCSEDVSVSCELSAVAWVKNGQDGHLVFGNDKTPKSGKESSIFSMPYAGGEFRENGPKNFYAFPPFSQAKKYEAMSITPDGSHVVATTAFDRYDENDAELDQYDVFIAWPSDSPNKAKVVSSSRREGVESSRTLRNRLMKAIQKKFGEQTRYLKMEGLALLPENRILFGIREIGQSFSSFDYHVTLLEGKYKIENEEFLLDETVELEVIRDFPEVSGIVGRTIGLSSIEYDQAKNRLYILTSYEDEKEKQIGAYLWVLPDENGKLGSSIYLVKTNDGDAFMFPHKAEGLTVLEGGRVFIIHDDDRNVTNIRIGGLNGGQLRARKPSEAAFDILRICADGEQFPAAISSAEGENTRQPCPPVTGNLPPGDRDVRMF